MARIRHGYVFRRENVRRPPPAWSSVWKILAARVGAEESGWALVGYCRRGAGSGKWYAHRVDTRIAACRRLDEAEEALIKDYTAKIPVHKPTWGASSPAKEED